MLAGSLPSDLVNPTNFFPGRRNPTLQINVKQRDVHTGRTSALSLSLSEVDNKFRRGKSPLISLVTLVRLISISFLGLFLGRFASSSPIENI